ncbi:unnamed protein product, partial [Ectocarpus sp. 4 AP-2014]
VTSVALPLTCQNRAFLVCHLNAWRSCFRVTVLKEVSAFRCLWKSQTVRAATGSPHLYFARSRSNKHLLGRGSQALHVGWELGNSANGSDKSNPLHSWYRFMPRSLVSNKGIRPAK